jgi:hypothetical protein
MRSRIWPISLCIFLSFLLHTECKAQITFTQVAGGGGDQANIGGAKDGGFAFADYDKDGDLDMLVNTNVNTASARSYLLRNDNGIYTDVTAAVAPALKTSTTERSASWGDCNGDGFPDILVNTNDRLRILRNNAGASFTSILDITTMTDGMNTEGAGWLDYDNDGDLDFFVECHNFGIDLFRNNGETPTPTFTQVTINSVGAAGTGSGGLGLPEGGSPTGDYASTVDLNNDGYVDIIARRENGGTNNGQDLNPYDIFFNQGNGKYAPLTSFNENTDNSNKGGIAAADFDNDGDFDLLWTSASSDGNRAVVYQQTGLNSGTFVMVANPFMLHNNTTETSTDFDGCTVGDIDNDGDLDVFMTQNSGTSKLFLNLSTGPGNFSFRQPGPSWISGAAINYGIDVNGDGEGCVFVDFDNDGDLDLYLNRNGATNQGWRNGYIGSATELAATYQNSYLRVIPLNQVSAGKTRPALNATVRLLDCNGNSIGGIREVSGGDGHGTQQSPWLHFGLKNGPNATYIVETKFTRQGTKPVIVRKAIVPSALATVSPGTSSLALEQTLFVRDSDREDDPDADGIIGACDTQLCGPGFAYATTTQTGTTYAQTAIQCIINGSTSTDCSTKALGIPDGNATGDFKKINDVAEFKMGALSGAGSTVTVDFDSFETNLTVEIKTSYDGLLYFPVAQITSTNLNAGLNYVFTAPTDFQYIKVIHRGVDGRKFKLDGFKSVYTTTIQFCDIDTDNDGVPNSTDVDDDNDGILDTDECTVTVNYPTLSNTAAYSFMQKNDGTAANHIGNAYTGGGNDPMNIFDNNLTTQLRMHQDDFFELSMGQTIPKGTAMRFIGGTNGDLENVIVYVSTQTMDPAGDTNNGTGGGLGWANASAGGSTMVVPSSPTNVDATFIAPFNFTHMQFYGVNSHGGWSELIFDPSPQVLYSELIEYCDSDFDGIPDSQDLDADGDGCLDVTEAGFTDANGDGQIDGTGIAANGMVLGSDGYTGPVPNASDPTVLAVSCDNDNDGIALLYDLDDDNDGILDADEGGCNFPSSAKAAFTGTSSGTAISTTGSANYAVTHGASVGYGAVTYTPGATGLQLGYAHVATTPDEFTNTLTLSSVSATTTPIIIAGPAIYATTGDNTASRYTISWTGGTGNAQFLDTARVGLDMYTYQPRGTHPNKGFVSSSFNTLERQVQGFSEAGEIVNGGSIVVYAVTNARAKWQIKFPPGATSVTVHKKVLTGATGATFGNDFRSPIPGYGTDVSGQSNNEHIAYQVEFVEGCTDVDTDGDGILDYLDFDSDNDGIYDLVEAGHGALDANNDGIIDGGAAAFGDNGYFNGLETSPESGIPNFVVADSDSDGIIDAQELDSDGDGCNDVIEAGFTDADEDGIIDGAGFDANGLVLGSDGYMGTAASVTDPSIVSLVCDTDNDGIAEEYDLDDDNDGIPDVDEMDCSANFIPVNSAGYALNTDFSSSSPMTGLGEYNAATFNFHYQLVGTATWSSGIRVLNNAAILPNGDYLNMQPSNTDLPNGNVARYILDFSTEVRELSLKYGGLDVGDHVRFSAYLSGVPVIINQSNITNINIPGANFSYYDSNTAISTSAAGNAPANSVAFKISQPVDSIVIEGGKESGNSSLSTTQIYEVKYCLIQDTDGDGVADHLDRDSDNDGIFDLVEAGHGEDDLNADGVIDGSDTLTGANGLFNALETSPDSGTLNYTVADSDADGIIDSQELDSDNDGCNDVIEAGFSDPDNDGILGN